MEPGDIVSLKVVDKTNFGLFLDWGQHDDLLLPKSEIHSTHEIGESVLVMICFDEFKDRYYASERIEEKLINNVNPGLFEKGDPVQGVVYAISPLGYKVCFNQHYTGVLYQNEVFKKLAIGDSVALYIKQIREDGKIDLALQKQGYKNVIGNDVDIVIKALKDNNDKLSLSDKSSPEDVYSTLGISKKRFKEAIGKLYKQRVIDITEKGITLKKK